MEFIKLIDRKELKEEAAKWFSSIWNVPMEAYLACMDEYLSGHKPLGWYLCLEDDIIIGGLGVIENDFHERKDLTPNICAVYTKKEYRNQGIAGKLLNMAVNDLKSNNISPVYLVTNHTNFYERYDWKYLCDVACDDGDISRLYIHE